MDRNAVADMLRAIRILTSGIAAPTFIDKANCLNRFVWAAHEENESNATHTRALLRRFGGDIEKCLRELGINDDEEAATEAAADAQRRADFETIAEHLRDLPGCDHVRAALTRLHGTD